MLRGPTLDQDEGTILQHKHKGDKSVCHRWDWRKKALKLVKEIPASGEFATMRAHVVSPRNGLHVHRLAHLKHGVSAICLITVYSGYLATCVSFCRVKFNVRGSTTCGAAPFLAIAAGAPTCCLDQSIRTPVL